MEKEGVEIRFKLIRKTKKEFYMVEEGELTKDNMVALFQKVARGNYELQLRSEKGLASFELRLGDEYFQGKSSKKSVPLYVHWSCFVREAKGDLPLMSQHCIMY